MGILYEQFAVDIAVLGRVTAVEKAELPEAVAGCFIDNPASGEELDGYDVLIRGWVLGRRSPVRCVRIVDPSLSRVVRETAPNEPRPDVEAHFPNLPNSGNAGFRVGFSLLNLRPDNRVEIWARLENGEAVRLAEVEYTRDRLDPGRIPDLPPLMVSSLGRSGSSRLMALLSRHPGIVVHGGHPYESRICKYYFHNLLKCASEPPGFLGPAGPDELYEANNAWLQMEMPNDPWLAQKFRTERIERLAAFGQREVDEIYGHLAAEQGKPAPRFFAEKHGAGQTPRLLWELYPDAREIILVRDFRDMFCSIVAFNRRRGNADFGMSESMTPEQFLEDLAQRVAGLAASYRSRTQDVLVVRYEDLVLRTGETLSKILDYAGLEGDAPVIERMLAGSGESTPREHRTTDDEEASVGRWKKDLPRRLRKRSTELFDGALRAFGYT